ncbi:MAG: tetratricopeptide repeat protein [Candidatus Xenobium sp.]|jgi:tetratricopeptide (TPR) repeat protein
MPPRRKSTDYSRRRRITTKPGAEGEQEERRISPQERRRQIMINLGVWFLVLVFAMSSGVMCYNIGGSETAQSGPEAQQAQQDPHQVEIDRWTRELQSNPNDPVVLANLGASWMRKAETLRSRQDADAKPNTEAKPEAEAASPLPQAGSPTPEATPEMVREDALLRAEEFLNRAIEKEPTYAFALQTLAEVKIAQNKPTEGREFLNRILALSDLPIPPEEDPETIRATRESQNTRARMTLARLETFEKNYDQALQILAQLEADHAGNADVHAMRAHIYEEQGRPEEAIKALDELARVAEVMNNAGMMLGARLEKSRLLQQTGDKAAARQEMEKARNVAESTGNPQAVMLVTQLLYNMDKPAPPVSVKGTPDGPAGVEPAPLPQPVVVPVSEDAADAPAEPEPAPASPPEPAPEQTSEPSSPPSP